MAGTFTERTNLFLSQFGSGTLTMRVEFDQVYAKYQELREDLRHPRGGQAHYLRDALLNHVESYMQRLASGTITERGSEIRDAAKRVAEDIAINAEMLTPREFYNLMRSAHPSVQDDEAVIYDRPPDVPRLSEAQLRAQRRRGDRIDYGGPIDRESVRP